MTVDPGTDPVTRQYERWRYPLPIEDLDSWLRDNWEWFDPSHAQRLLWPDRPYRPDMDILIAGCGTNQAAVFAFTNPAARVVGIDVSSASLQHHRYLRDKYGLSNLTLHQLPLEELPSLDLDFDLVVSTGVLHHLADPRAGLRALAACARPDAAIGIMLYAKYGRLGVQLLTSVFHDLQLQQDQRGVAMVREILAMVPKEHPVRAYLGIARDLTSDAAIVDTFLHPRERSYSVDGCLDLLASAGLVFQDWLLHAPYYLHEMLPSASGLSSIFDALPPATQWSVMERLFPANACHFFLACRPERPSAAYTLDFSSDKLLDSVPAFRRGCGLSGAEVFRWDWRLALDTTQLRIVEQVDGRRTVGEILAALPRTTSLDKGGAGAREATARQLFRSLWQLDLVTMALNGGCDR